MTEFGSLAGQIQAHNQDVQEEQRHSEQNDDFPLRHFNDPLIRPETKVARALRRTGGFGTTTILAPAREAERAGHRIRIESQRYRQALTLPPDSPGHL